MSRNAAPSALNALATMALLLLLALCLAPCNATAAGPASDAPVPQPVGDPERSALEDLLDLLRAKGQLTAAEHAALSAKALAEKEAQHLALEQARAEARTCAAAAASPVPAGSDSPAGGQSSAAPAGGAPAKASDLRISYKDGLTFQSADKSLDIKLFGRLKFDYGSLWTDQAGRRALPRDLGSGVAIPLARLGVTGRLYEQVLFRAEFDFANNTVGLKDTYLGYDGIPWLGTLLAGYMKEPMGLDQYGGDGFLTFMEPALPLRLGPQRNTGLRLNNTVAENRLTWQFGVFLDTDSGGNSGLRDYDSTHVTARVTGLPLWLDDGAHYLHLGLAYSHQFLGGGTRPIAYKAGPESRLVPDPYLATGNLAAREADLLGGEFAYNYGPLNLQAEYLQSTLAVDPDLSKGHRTLTFQGASAQASFYLTGEHRPYDQRSGTFGRLQPLHPFDPWGGGGWGAWQVAGRYSFLDLNDRHVQGGRQEDLTALLKWQPNALLGVYFEYIRSWVYDRSSGGVQYDKATSDLFQMRLQVDF